MQALNNVIAGRCSGDICWGNSCLGANYSGAICPGKDGCPGGHLSGWAICPGKELIGVFHEAHRQAGLGADLEKIVK